MTDGGLGFQGPRVGPKQQDHSTWTCDPRPSLAAQEWTWLPPPPPCQVSCPGSLSHQSQGGEAGTAPLGMNFLLTDRSQPLRAKAAAVLRAVAQTRLRHPGSSQHWATGTIVQF